MEQSNNNLRTKALDTVMYDTIIMKLELLNQGAKNVLIEIKPLSNGSGNLVQLKY